MDISDIVEWLAVDPDPKADLEMNADGSTYIPIWKVETWLDELCEDGWSRQDHKYSFHPGHSSEWLATSHTLEISYAGVKRVLLCSSFINTAEYPNNGNILQTGIAEATKAGVKVLGSRFGKNLNDRTSIKQKPSRERIKKPADPAIENAYRVAFSRGDMDTMKRLLDTYEIKTEDIHVEN